MGGIKRQVIGVIGVPGAWTNQVGKALVRAGVLVLWPDQSLHIEGDRYLYDSNCENPEVNRMHNQVFKSCRETRYSGGVPRFFDMPFPGPEQFLAKFPADKNIGIVDNALCLMWDIWGDHLTDIVIAESDLDGTTTFLRRWIDGNMTTEECVKIFDLYTSQIHKINYNFSNVHFLDVESLRSNQEIDTAINSILLATDGYHD